MTYTYRVLGLAHAFSQFRQLFINRLVEQGVEIKDKDIGAQLMKLKLRHGDEVADVEARLVGPDIEIRFNVGESLEKKGAEMLRTGLTFLGSIISGGSIADATIYAAEESIDKALSGEAGYLASTIANTAKSVEEEIRSKRMELPPPPPPGYGAPTVPGELQRYVSEIRSRIISIREEMEIAREEGRNVEPVERRLERADALFNEALTDMNRGDISIAEAKLKAAERLIERAERVLEEIMYR